MFDSVNIKTSLIRNIKLRRVLFALTICYIQLSEYLCSGTTSDSGKHDIILNRKDSVISKIKNYCHGLMGTPGSYKFETSFDLHLEPRYMTLRLNEDKLFNDNNTKLSEITFSRFKHSEPVTKGFNEQFDVPLIRGNFPTKVNFKVEYTGIEKPPGLPNCRFRMEGDTNDNGRQEDPAVGRSPSGINKNKGNVKHEEKKTAFSKIDHSRGDINNCEDDTKNNAERDNPAVGQSPNDINKYRDISGPAKRPDKSIDNSQNDTGDDQENSRGSQVLGDSQIDTELAAVNKSDEDGEIGNVQDSEFDTGNSVIPDTVEHPPQRTGHPTSSANGEGGYKQSEVTEDSLNNTGDDAKSISKPEDVQHNQINKSRMDIAGPGVTDSTDTGDDAKSISKPEDVQHNQINKSRMDIA
eukprot:941727_1